MISRTRLRIVLACLAVGVALGSCAELTALPGGSERFEAPPEYRLWWSMVESCSGLHGSLADVDWYVVPGSTSIVVGNGDYSGYWFEQGNRIVLAANAQSEGTLVRHEMLHALTRGGHTRNEFLERCAGIVNCETGCVADAGPPPIPPAGAALVAPSALDVQVEIQPASPGSGSYGGYFVVIVSARNPATHDVIVQLPPSGDTGAPGSFTFSVRSGAFSSGVEDRASDPEVTWFAAGETKREAFDLHLYGDQVYGGVDPGTYTAYGSYGDQPASPTVFTISP